MKKLPESKVTTWRVCCLHRSFCLLIFILDVIWCMGVQSTEMKTYYVGVMMASHLDSPFDLERCGPAVDLALDQVNEIFLAHHNIQLKKVQAR